MLTKVSGPRHANSLYSLEPGFKNVKTRHSHAIHNTAWDRKQRPQGRLAGGDLCRLDRAGTAAAPEARRQPGGRSEPSRKMTAGAEPGGRGSAREGQGQGRPQQVGESPLGPSGPGCQGPEPEASLLPREELLLIGKLDELGLPAAPPCRLRFPPPTPPHQRLLQGLQAGPPAGWRSSPPGYLSWRHSTVTAHPTCHHAHLPVSTWVLPTCPAHLPLGLLARDAMSHPSVIL